MEHLQRMWHARRERLPFRIHGSVAFWDFLKSYAPVNETIFQNLPWFHLEYP